MDSVRRNQVGTTANSVQLRRKDQKKVVVPTNSKMQLHTNLPLVSICIPTYNSSAYLKETLDSLVKQTYRPIEIIISDNCSTDNTCEIVSLFTNKLDIKLYKSDKNIGPEGNFNKVVSYAEGVYVAIYHSDDVYESNTVQLQVERLINNPNIALVFTNYVTIDERGRIISRRKISKAITCEVGLGYKEFLLEVIRSYGQIICTPSAMLPAQIYKQHLPYNWGEFNSAADLDLWLRVSVNHRVAFISQPCLKYRISRTHGSFTTRLLRTRPADFFNVIDTRIKCGEKINWSDRNILEFYRDIDRKRCVINHLILNGLKHPYPRWVSFGLKNLWSSCIIPPKMLIYWLVASFFVNINLIWRFNWFRRLISRLLYGA